MVYKCSVFWEKPHFSYCSSLPKVCWKAYPIFGYWNLWLETLPPAQPLTLVCHSCWVDDTLFIGGFSYEHHFPGFQLRLQNDRLQCALALHFLPGATCMEKKKPECTEMQSICVRNAARLLLCWAVLLQKDTLVPAVFSFCSYLAHWLPGCPFSFV